MSGIVTWKFRAKVETTPMTTMAGEDDRRPAHVAQPATSVSKTAPTERARIDTGRGGGELVWAHQQERRDDSRRS